MTPAKTISALPEPLIANLLCAMLECAEPFDFSDEMHDAIFDLMGGDLTAMEAIAAQPIGESGRDPEQKRADYRSAA